MSDELEPIEPREAFELWMERQQSRKAEETLSSYRYRVEPFIDWLEAEGFDDLNDLSGRDILRFDAERQRPRLAPGGSRGEGQHECRDDQQRLRPA